MYYIAKRDLKYTIKGKKIFVKKGYKLSLDDELGKAFIDSDYVEIFKDEVKSIDKENKIEENKVIKNYEDKAIKGTKENKNNKRGKK